MVMSEDILRMIIVLMAVTTDTISMVFSELYINSDINLIVIAVTAETPQSLSLVLSRSVSLLRLQCGGRNR